MLKASVIADLFLAHRDSRFFAGIDVVSVETSCLHKFKGSLLAFDGNWVRSLGIPRDTGSLKTIIKKIKKTKESKFKT